MAFTTKDCATRPPLPAAATLHPDHRCGARGLDSRLAEYTDTAPVTLNAQTTNYTLVLTDAGKLVTTVQARRGR